MKPSFKMKDMRRSARKELWCECSLTAQGAELREGVILDISQRGARVRFRRRGSLPDIVQIRAARIGLNRTARVAWQTVFDAGLEFIQAGQSVIATDPKPSQGERSVEPNTNPSQRNRGGFGKRLS